MAVTTAIKGSQKQKSTYRHTEHTHHKHTHENTHKKLQTEREGEREGREKSVSPWRIFQCSRVTWDKFSSFGIAQLTHRIVS